jgi:hypothetical protein
MQVKAEDEMALLIEACLSELDETEAAYIRECQLQEPRTPFPVFAERWRLSQKTFTELRSRAESRLRERLAAKNVHSLGDLL